MDDTAATLLGYSLQALLGNQIAGLKGREAIAIVAQYAKAYTRGEGFDAVTGNPNDDVAAVIITAAARLVTSPSQIDRKSVGSLSISYSTFQGWTLMERVVLNRYRQRTA